MSEPQTVKYNSTCIVDNDVLAEVFLALMPNSLIILYYPDAVQETINAIPCSLFLVTLCDVDAAVLARGLQMCKEVRALRPMRAANTTRTIDKLAVADSVAVADGGATVADIVAVAEVTYFDLNDFFDYVPVPQ